VDAGVTLSCGRVSEHRRFAILIGNRGSHCRVPRIDIDSGRSKRYAKDLPRRKQRPSVYWEMSSARRAFPQQSPNTRS